MQNSVERFSNRVENYARYRPDYPRAIVAHLVGKCGLTKNSIVADIGCGTGISSRIFLENGNRVFGVEPNAGMLAAAQSQLTGFPDFIPVNGTSERTPLGDNSVDFVVAAQAFHWFDPDKTRPEFERVLKSGGHIVLIWNERQLDTTPFLIEYEAFLLKYAVDYQTVRHENVNQLGLREFFQKDYGSATFQNAQAVDFDGLKGRLLSASYMPDESAPIFGRMIEELRVLFAKHSENDRIKVFYDTNVYYSRALTYGSNG